MSSYLIERTWDAVRLALRRRGITVNVTPLIAGVVVAGCCSTVDIQHSRTSDLQLRRYDLKHCLSTARMGWDKQQWQPNGDDLRADLDEKAAIEGEITRRDVTDYHRPPFVTDGYVHDRCHCQEWIVNL
jgi:hypothetical protein